MVKINGVEYELLFNGSAMFKMRELYGDDNIAELLEGQTAITFQRTCKLAVILAEQGELLRRWLGYDQKEMLTEELLRLSLSPIGFLHLKNAVFDAVYEGYSREVKDENEEIDLGLAELNKKKVTL